MAIQISSIPSQNWKPNKQHLINNIGSGIPAVAYDAVAINFTATTVRNEMGDFEYTYTWTPLSSYLGKMRTKIAKQQLFDRCSA